MSCFSLNVAAGLLLLTIAGCGPGFLPENGPAGDAVIRGAQHRIPSGMMAGQISYALIPLSQDIVSRLPPDDGAPRFALTNAIAAEGLIGVGDIVGITVFESDSGGLFLPAQSGTRVCNCVTLPNQQVDKSGNISVPFATSAIHAAGRTTRTVQQTIENNLKGRALEPQVIVTIVDRRADTVNVLGEITATAHFSLDPGGERILGAIARAGGPRFPAYESMVTLSRDGSTQQALMSEIARDPTQNIQLQPGDTVYVAHEPRYFIALGATGTSASIGPIDRRIPFQDRRIVLADALARAGGIDDTRANVKAAFVFRFERPATLETLGIVNTGARGEDVPTVYQVDLADPAGLFYASHFPMRSEDVVFVSNAPAVDLAKLLSLLLPGASSASAIRATVQ